MKYRIKLSDFKKLDSLEDYKKWLSDDEVFKYLESDTPKSSLDQINEYIELNNNLDCIFKPVIFIKNNKHIGNLKIYNFSQDQQLKSAEYSRFIGDKSYWGMGLGFELGILALDYCFRNLKLDCVHAGCIEENIAAIKSNKKLGFKEVKRIKNIESKNIMRFKITKEEFLKVPNE
tara:strand:+ start:18478 stop:19002 length:525 start_codon:yes stop_codon:yes gene_type:complete